jgi:hypothetical protein
MESSKAKFFSFLFSSSLFSQVMYMYYLLSFKLLRRKQGGHNVSQNTTRLDMEFIGFSEFLRSLPEDKKIAVGKQNENVF